MLLAWVMEAATRKVLFTHGRAALEEEREMLRELSATYADDVNSLSTRLDRGVGEQRHEGAPLRVREGHV